MAKVKRKASANSKGKSDESSPPISERSKKLSKVVGSIDGFELWSEVKPPKICPTRITSFNRAIKCGGIPGGMLGVLHGPSSGGKTLLLAEFLYDAWVTGGWGLFVDAECRGVDLKWFSAICGNLSEVLYYKPRTYEDCIDRIEVFRKKFRDAKKNRDVPEGSFLAIGIDSVNRLTPGTELEEILKGKVEARGYPIRALLTSKWLDKIIPTLERDEILIFVQRESRKLDSMPGQRTYRVKGGTAPIYDGGWICRVTSAARVKVEVEGSEDKVLVGEKHEIEVIKNSLGPHLNELAFFYSSVGADSGAPLGFDFVREVREEALHRKVVTFKRGSGYFLGDERIASNKGELLNWFESEIPMDGDGIVRRKWELIAEKLNDGSR